MEKLQSFNTFISKHMAFVTPTCLVLGVLTAAWMNRLSFMVPGLFAFMTFEGSLGTDFKAVGNVARHPAPLLAVLVILHLAMPLIALGVGLGLYGNNANLVTGILLEFLVPTGIVSLTWVGIYDGNIPMTLSVIVVDTLIAPLIIPFMMQIMLGSVVTISSLGMMVDLIEMIAIPALIGMGLNQMTHGKITKTVKPVCAPFAKICMILVVTINSTRIAPYLTHLNGLYICVALTILALAVSGYLVAWVCARAIHADRPTVVSMLFGGGMRNISAGAVIAAQYFPGEVMFPVMIGTLFQQVLAAFVGTMVERKTRDSREAV
ncbi:MAG: bile acid:sodium symporter family protein [Eubacteriaceae bacterium]|nr:bile acid:sodium symporter family protein [Eubacteriaceae bacterium]